MERRTLILLGIVIIAVGVSVILLVTGGAAPEASADDAKGDVKVGRGGTRPKDTSIADIQTATVRHDGSDLIFSVVMVGDIPREFSKEALSWRWELYESDRLTWIVSANVDLGPNVSVVATQKNYSTSTVDDTLPGEIDLEGKTLTVRIRADDVDGFPAAFAWFVETSLDGSRLKATSALAKDRAPDGGFLQLVE